MNIWPSKPLPLRPVDWETVVRAKSAAVLSYQQLCTLAGVSPRISWPDLRRRIHVLREGQHAYPVGKPDDLGVVLPNYRGTPEDALRILETLAHGFFDSAAREAVRGRSLFMPPTRGGANSQARPVQGPNGCDV